MAEKATNPLLQATGEDAFVAALLASLGSYPPYFRRLGQVNRRGPAVLDGDPVLASVDAAVATQMLSEGAVLVDTRPLAEFAAGHLPGAHNVELGDLTIESPTAGPSGRQLVVMCGHGERAMTGASVLERGGHRDVAVLVGGAEDWAAAHGTRLDTGE